MYAKESIKMMNGNYNANNVQIHKVTHGLAYVSSILESFHKTYWLAAGTLLGKLSF